MAPNRSSHIPDDTYEELIEATITALYRTGYAALGVRDIDEEFSKSRQLINHYFDGKDDLITGVLEYLLHDDDALAAGSMDADPLTKLTMELDSILLGTTTDDAEFWPIMTAVYEIQAQAHHNPEHQRLLNEISESYVSYLSGILKEGIEEGEFRDIDERRTAALLDDLVTGAHVRKIHLGQDEAPADARETIDRLVLSHLLVDADGDSASPE